MNNSSSKKTISIAIIMSFILNFILNGAVYFFIVPNFESIKSFTVPFWIIFIVTSLNIYLITLLTSFFTSKRVNKYLEKGLLLKKETKSFLSNISDRPFYFAFSLIGIFMIPITLTLAFIFSSLTGVMDMYSTLGFINFRTIFRAAFSGVYGALVTYLVLRRAQIK